MRGRRWFWKRIVCQLADGSYEEHEEWTLDVQDGNQTDRRSYTSPPRRIPSPGTGGNGGSGNGGTGAGGTGAGGTGAGNSGNSGGGGGGENPFSGTGIATTNTADPDSWVPVVIGIGTAIGAALENIRDALSQIDLRQAEPAFDPARDGFGNGVLDAVEDVLQETFPDSSNPDLDPNNINNPGIPPFTPPDTAHRDPEPPVVTDRFESSPPWRGTPVIEDGNPKKGWKHIDERHITGNAPSGAGDLFPPGTTRPQVEEAARDVVQNGTRVSNPSSPVQIFEDRITVNGQRDRVRVVVDSSNGTVITIFPVRSE
jgi:hypothetical protein